MGALYSGRTGRRDIRTGHNKLVWLLVWLIISFFKIISIELLYIQKLL